LLVCWDVLTGLIEDGTTDITTVVNEYVITYKYFISIVLKALTFTVSYEQQLADSCKCSILSNVKHQNDILK